MGDGREGEIKKERNTVRLLWQIKKKWTMKDRKRRNAITLLGQIEVKYERQRMGRRKRERNKCYKNVSVNRVHVKKEEGKFKYKLRCCMDSI
jgi:hypothetical protein